MFSAGRGDSYYYQTIIYLHIINLPFPGSKFMGKMSIWLSAFSGLVLLVLFSLACSLEGGSPWNTAVGQSGFSRFLTPDWDKLLTATVWYEAISQNVFSMGIGNGSLFKMGSENNFRRNIYAVVFWVAGVDFCVSLTSGEIISQIKFIYSEKATNFCEIFP